MAIRFPSSRTASPPGTFVETMVSRVARRMNRLCLLVVLVLTSCRSESPFPKVVLGPNPIEPLWSMPAGCSGGIEITPGRVSVTHRIGPNQYENWMMDADSGRVLQVADQPTWKGHAPNDSPTQLTQGVIKALDASVASTITPRGFSPVVLTERFLFAKRTRTRFARFHLSSEGQIVAVDRTSGDIVWTDEGPDIVVLATPARVFVCDEGQTSAFAPNAGRPAEVSEFYAAVRAGNLSVVRRLYARWRRTGMYDVGGGVPLSVASKEGHLDVAEVLVALGESPNAGDADGFTPLQMALHWENASVADFLLNAGAVPTDDGGLWSSPLRIAVRAGKRPIIMHLIRSGAKIDFVEPWSGGTALHEAVMYRNYEAIETLISAGANVKARDRDGKTPLDLAPLDACVVHLFAGGTIEEKPTTCQPVKRESISIHLPPWPFFLF